MESLLELIDGCLLGDGCIRDDKGKYFTFQLVGKDVNFLEWVRETFIKYEIKGWISRNKSDLFLLGFYMNSYPNQNLLSLRSKWYAKIKNKTTKKVPRNLNLTPTTLLFWYLGDGCLVRRKNDDNRVPTIVLATNCFSKEDIDFLILKLKELNLNFYPIEYQSGFNKGQKCGFCLYSKTEDGTPLRFFQYIGLECPNKIRDFTTGSKGIYHEKKFFRDKWPNQEDWIKILSNVKGYGGMLRKRRLDMGLSQNQFGNLIGIRRENIRDVELNKRNFRVKNLRKVLNSLQLAPYDILNTL